jgi:predicted PurR-regulated permease PerM
MKVEDRRSLPVWFERDLLQRIEHSLSSQQGVIASRILSTTTLVLEIVGAAILTLLTFFLLKDGPWMQSWALGRVSEPTAVKLRAAGQAAWHTLSGYVRGVAIIGLFDATFIGIGLAVIGVPLVASLGRWRRRSWSASPCSSSRWRAMCSSRPG